MIFKKTWKRKWTGLTFRYNYTGWFLFGFIPLYIYREDRY